ncbi:MAG TPA: AsmA-like C-terminal region-containing protein [Burkholderiales bacterium]|nr:AsmA-like C-terminal region-containing protein [Burkholderiales bacterium]
MDRKTILSKTAKGLNEATGKTSDLPRDLRNLLKEIDGKVTVGQLQMRQELFTEAKFMEALRNLERDGYVREAVAPASEPSAPRSQPSGSDSGGADLDFTAIASRTGAKQATDISRQIAAERERVEAAAKAKAEAEEQAKKLAYQSEAKREREEMDRIHREAEGRSRKAAEEKARREAEEKAKREAEASAAREAEERARREAEEKAKREAEERARREAEARARREAEEKARREAEEKARREAEEKARREAEERRRREEEERRREQEQREAEKRRAEEQRREEEEERRRKEEDRRRWEIEAKAEAAELEAQIRLSQEAKQPQRGRGAKTAEASELEAAMRAEREEAEERARHENEERVRREEEERRRSEEAAKLPSASGDDLEAEMRRREEEMRQREKEEGERAKQEAKARAESDAKAAAEVRARDKARQDDERRSKPTWLAAKTAQAKRVARRPGNFGRSMAIGLFLILAIFVAVMHYVPIDATGYEKTAQQWLGQPVRIGAVYVQLVPSPQLRFEKVTIGQEPQLRIPTVRAEFAITSLFDERKSLRKIELEGGTLPQRFLAGLVSGAGAPGAAPGTQRVLAKGIRLDIPGFGLPDLDIDAEIDPRGGLAGVRFSGQDGKLSGTLKPEGGHWVLDLSADQFTLPIGGKLTLDEFSAKGALARNEIAFTQLEGRALKGAILANGHLRWGDVWTLEGEFTVRQMDAGRIASPVVAGGVLEGKGTYGMKAKAPDKLLDAMRMEGNFTIQKGSITNVDMMRILQGSVTAGGTTLFTEMSGSATADSGRIQVRQLHMAAGLLQGAGSVDVDSEKNMSGRMQIELRAQTVQARATMAISGSVDKPLFRRIN